MKNTGVIFKRALRDSRTAMIWWGIGLAIYAFLVVIIYPAVQGFEGINELLSNPVMQVILGDEVADLTSPGGFLNSYFFLMMPLILAVYNVLYGLGVTAAEEDRGTLDVLLSRPVPRWQLIAEKMAALIVSQIVIAAITLIGFVAGLLITPSLTVNMGDLLLGVLSLVPVMVCVTALTVLLSTVLRSRGAAGGIVAAFLVASYFVNTLAGLMEAPLDNVRYLSIFYYYGGGRVMTRGVDWGGFLLLMGLSAALVALAMPLFQRRNLGT